MKRTSSWLVALVAMLALLVRPVWADSAKAAEADKASDTAKKADTKTTVPVFRLHGSVSETPTDDTFPFSTEQTLALKDLTARIRKAGEDKDVKAVVMTLSDISLGWAQI